MSDFYYVKFNYVARERKQYDHFVIWGSGEKGIRRDMMNDPSFPDLEIEQCVLYSDALDAINTKRDDEGNMSEELINILNRQEVFKTNWEFRVNPWEIPPYWQWEARRDGIEY